MVLRAGCSSSVIKMSNTPEEPTSARVRRQQFLPAHLDAYDLTGFTRTSRQGAEESAHHNQSSDEDSEKLPEAAGGQRSTSPISQGSYHQLMVKEKWPSRDDVSASGIKRLRKDNKALQGELEMLQLQNEELRLQNRNSEFKLEQLSRKSSFDTDQLRRQVDHLSKLIQTLQMSGAPAKDKPAIVPPPEEKARRKQRPSSPGRWSKASRDSSPVNSSGSEGETEYRDRKFTTIQSLEPRSSFQRPSHPPMSRHSQSRTPSPVGGREQSYRGPKPTIPNMTQPSPREFSRLRIALENLLPSDASERFRYQILVDHLKAEEALLIADSYSNSTHPYSDTMAALDLQYGQPHQLALQRIAEVMDGPSVATGDIKAFRMFALRVRSLVGMLQQLGRKGKVELECGSHVSRLLAKLPHDMRFSFRRCIHPHRVPIPTLLDLADWLEFELQVQEDGSRFSSNTRKEKESKTKGQQRLAKARGDSSTVLLSTSVAPTPETVTAPASSEISKKYCPYCDNTKHSLNNCANFTLLTTAQKQTWVKANNRCWRCGRGHRAAECTLKMRCKTCNCRHLLTLHEVNEQSKEKPVKECRDQDKLKVESRNSNAEEVLYIDRPLEGRKVLLKLSKVVLRNGDRVMEAYAILDDGSERTILLHSAAEQLGLEGDPEDLHLRTVRQELQIVHGAVVSFTISAAGEHQRTFRITRAFTAKRLGLAEHSYPVHTLQKKYRHLQDLPLQPFQGVHPVLLIGSDHPHLITPVEPVRLGPPGGPAAVRTRLGWTLQGPAHGMRQYLAEQQCLFIATSFAPSDIYKHVERLWQMDTLPWRNERLCTRSRQDSEAMSLLESRTTRLNIEGVYRYATPLLRVQNMPQLRAPKEAVLPHLRGLERRLARDQEKAAAYIAEMRRLVTTGYVHKLESGEEDTPVSWYIPHHMVAQNGKNRVVFNCSFEFGGKNLNKLLLPGPTLGPTLLAVLLRFREHAVAFSSDIRGMFHQVRLLPEDQPLLRFLWRDLKREKPPDIYEWSVLPFGTTCSPCCAVFALQRHILDHSKEGDAIRDTVLKSFYVDNCLKSLTSEEDAKALVNQLQETLNDGGFELRQWASNRPSVIAHFLPDTRSDNAELWMAQGQLDVHESALGLHWHCPSDSLSYKHRPLEHTAATTMRTIYQVLASQYDPLGFIVPYTTRAKLVVQRLWDRKRDWDDPSLPDDLLHVWQDWESELPALQQIIIPRCYSSAELDSSSSKREIHIFCDASEKAYGSVAYLRTEAPGGEVEIAFLNARSRVAPKKQQSIPRLELCAALSGAQLYKVLKEELTLPIHSVTLWTDSTTVLAWLQSDSCRFKVFVGTRIVEIQDMTDREAWRYVDSASNPADDITRGKLLSELTADSRWFQGPPFLWEKPDQWPRIPQQMPIPADSEELRKSIFCGLASTGVTPVPDAEQFQTFRELVEATALALHEDSSQLTADSYREAERILLQKSQQDCFELDRQQLMAGKPLSRSSHLLPLAPEFDASSQLIRVGGRLRQATALAAEALHPIVLDPKHQVTQLLIKHYDDQLHHPGSERVLAEMRRKYWILRGREAIRRQQHHCLECKRWRGKPAIPRMADLPPARLRLHQPAFYSTGVDCFGPYTIKVGRRTEKRWGIIFKCMTTRAVHLDLVPSMDCDSFLMALRRFVARRGKPSELLSDQGTNFKAGERELREAFAALSSDLKAQLAAQQIQFTFNPPNAPHFGGCWEREIRSLKQALQVTIGTQSVSEEVLRTLFIEIEGILNSKPLGYTSSDVADPDPVTPNTLLMGRPDASLPQVVYRESEILSRRRWRHSQLLADHFWKTFIRCYLPSLQARQKWLVDAPSLDIGHTAMVVDPQLPRALWPVGKITRTAPGPDGRVRVVEVKVGDRFYTRPVARIIRLPSLPD